MVAVSVLLIDHVGGKELGSETLKINQENSLSDLGIERVWVVNKRH